METITLQWGISIALAFNAILFSIFYWRCHNAYLELKKEAFGLVRENEKLRVYISDFKMIISHGIFRLDEGKFGKKGVLPDRFAKKIEKMKLS